MPIKTLPVISLLPLISWHSAPFKHHRDRLRVKFNKKLSEVRKSGQKFWWRKLPNDFQDSLRPFFEGAMFNRGLCFQKFSKLKPS
jgi:hypothetical protein